MLETNKTVCFEIDEYINDKDKTHWFVDLSDGTRVFGDDGRYGPDDNSWYRLKEYIESNKLDIVMMKLRFRSHVEEIGIPKNGAFFRKGLLAEVMTGNCQQQFICGLVDGDTIYTQAWNVPELIKSDMQTGTRPLEGNESCVIFNSSIH